MNEDAALNRLGDLCPIDEEPTLSEAQLERCLALGAVEDADGLLPGEDDYTPTYSDRGVYLAAREAWILKKARAASRFDFTTDGQSFRRSQVADHCDEMIRRMNAKLALTTTVTQC